MAVTLYKRQRQIVDFISQYIQTHGYSPTLSEIAVAINVSSLATVHEHLQALIKKKIIRKYEGAVRGIELLDKTIGQIVNVVELPILGYIAAGKPIQPYTDPNAQLKVSPTMLTGKRKAFVLQVKGDSMIEEGIFDSDYVVCEEVEDAKDRDIVVAMLDNGLCTLKRYFREKTRIRLEPANATMSPIFATNVRIQGRVVGVIRRYSNE
ncbi:repressor LexA [Candidatus Collierbacteria bacterium RIFOXYB1_FULL_49_13]|uniref:LexA repressor n=1 Tax=Candidatus Collierbacteria bacterium RIFOXYB1_FULL_49_13 TaxID=1817728 RepID=A0A1F5FJ38_9BACT|nr:MAG: repressor LexA [Candidatus Collierbacteria bacterium RIFOXYB1_FULL_49_13]